VAASKPNDGCSVLLLFVYKSLASNLRTSTSSIFCMSPSTSWRFHVRPISNIFLCLLLLACFPHRQVTPQWSDYLLMFDFFRPHRLPEFDSFKAITVSLELSQIIAKALDDMPQTLLVNCLHSVRQCFSTFFPYVARITFDENCETHYLGRMGYAFIRINKRTLF